MYICPLTHTLNFTPLIPNHLSDSLANPRPLVVNSTNSIPLNGEVTYPLNFLTAF